MICGPNSVFADLEVSVTNLSSGANEGPVLRGEVERAASLENQAIIDTSAIASTAEHEKALPSQSTASTTSDSGKACPLQKQPHFYDLLEQTSHLLASCTLQQHSICNLPDTVAIQVVYS